MTRAVQSAQHIFPSSSTLSTLPLRCFILHFLIVFSHVSPSFSCSRSIVLSWFPFLFYVFSPSCFFCWRDCSSPLVLPLCPFPLLLVRFFLLFYIIIFVCLLFIARPCVGVFFLPFHYFPSLSCLCLCLFSLLVYSIAPMLS